jgi:hypothetical protein
MRDEHYEAALKFCQKYGYEGDELPPYGKGPPSKSCPIARALNGTWGFTSGHLADGTEVHSSCTMLQFIARVDAGLYPELGRPSWSDFPEMG